MAVALPCGTCTRARARRRLFLLTRLHFACILCVPARAPRQSDFQKNKWKGAIFVGTVTAIGIWLPWKCVGFAQRKAGVW